MGADIGDDVLPEEQEDNDQEYDESLWVSGM